MVLKISWKKNKHIITSSLVLTIFGAYKSKAIIAVWSLLLLFYLRPQFMYVHHSVRVKMSSKLHSQYKSILIWLLFTMWTLKLRMKHNIMFSISFWFSVFCIFFLATLSDSQCFVWFFLKPQKDNDKGNGREKVKKKESVQLAIEMYS